VENTSLTDSVNGLHCYSQQRANTWYTETLIQDQLNLICFGVNFS